MKQRNVLYIIVSMVVVWNIISYMTMVSKPSQPVTNKDDIKTKLDRLEAALQVQMDFNRHLLKQLQQEREAVKETAGGSNQEVARSLPVNPVGEANKAPPSDNKSVLGLNTSKEATSIPILIIACNRPDAIKRSLDQLIDLPHDENKHPIIVSQDCGEHRTAEMVRSYGTKVKLLEHKDNSEIKVDAKSKKFIGYYKIARHYKWALTQIFDVLNHDAVIIVEDDLDIAPDFYEYFDATYHILHADPTLWCVSAWNDNGKVDKVSNSPELLYRTDFFPGLGWMMERKLWNELKEKWPVTFWDDWMRQPAQRQDRACIRPEISRTKTFGEKGVSKGQFYKKYLQYIKLNDKKIEFTKQDLSYLMKSNFDVRFVEQVYNCKTVNIDEAMAGNFPEECVRVQYSDKNSFKNFAKRLSIMEDIKSGVPRTGYRGVVPVMVGSKRLYLAPPANWKGYDLSWN